MRKPQEACNFEHAKDNARTSNRIRLPISDVLLYRCTHSRFGGLRDQVRGPSLKEQVECFFERQVTQLRGDGGIELPNSPQQTISVSSNMPRCLRSFTGVAGR